MDEKTQFEEKTIAQGKWLMYKHITFKVKEKEIVWELVDRPNYKGGVSLCVIFKKKNQKDQLLLIASFRSFPQVCVIQMTLQQMEQENQKKKQVFKMNMRIILRLGYTPNKVFKHYSCEKRMYSDPWKSREYGYLMIVSVDGDAEENQNPKQSLEVEENIRTHFVDLDENICENLQKLAEENKYDINSKVWTFALGISFRKIIDQQQ